MEDSNQLIIDRGFIQLNHKEYLWTVYESIVELFDGEEDLIFDK